ncbi:hypothetical protein CBL_10622 [Carabus blaptoides fortunei]
MSINKLKTKTMIVNGNDKLHSFQIEGQAIGQVKAFTYLGIVIKEKGKKRSAKGDKSGRVQKSSGTSTNLWKRILDYPGKTLKKIEGKAKMDKIRNKVFRTNLNTKSVEHTIQGQLKWTGHLRRMTVDRPVKQIYQARPHPKRKSGRPGKTWEGEVKRATEKWGLRGKKPNARCKTDKQWREVWKRNLDENTGHK